jgi:hypothetical protein
MEKPITKSDLESALTQHTKDEMPRLKEMIEGAINSAKNELLHAFPDGIEHHREAHERMIAAAKAEEMFWHDLKIDIARKSIWGILHILVLLTIGTLAVKLGVGSVLGIGK